MKKFLSLILAVIMVMLSIPMTATKADAATEYTDGDFKYTLENGEATITGFDSRNTGYMTWVDIPTEINDYPVTKIGDSAFEDSNISRLDISDNIISIGDRAFKDCIYLQWVDISYSHNLKSIGTEAFANCSMLEYIAIPDSVTSIGGAAFISCTSLRFATIGNSVERIGGSAFSSCGSIEYITVPKSVTYIGPYAFSFNPNVKIYYSGSKEEWSKITIDGVNSSGWNYAMYYNYCRTNHKSVTVLNAVPATTTTEGYTGDTYCKDCDNIISVGEVIPKLINHGDVTGDGKINLTDVSTILKHIAKWDIEMNTDAADVNCDGKINLTDVSTILKYIAKWDVVLGK